MRNLNFVTKQKEVLFCNNNKIFVHGGYGGGKSTVLLFKMIQICRFMPGSKFIVGRYTHSALEKDTYEILFNTQDGLLNGLGVFKRKPDVFEFPNGSKMFFTHFDSPKDLVGGSVTGYLIEQAEQIKEDVFKALQSRVRHWGRKDVKGSNYNQYMDRYKDDPNVIKPPRSFEFIVANPDSTSFLKKKFIESPNKQGMNWSIFQVNMHDNKENLPDGYIEEQIRDNNELYVKRMVYGSWEAAEGLIYPEFDRIRHVKDSEPIKEVELRENKEFKYICIMDPGIIHRFGCIWAAVHPNGKLEIFDELYEKDKTAIDMVPLIKMTNKLNGLEGKIEYIIDPASEKRDQTSGRSTADILRQNGINANHAIKDVIPGIMMVKDALKKESIIFHSHCVNTIKEFTLYMWNPRDPDKPLKKNDDLMDPVRYLVMRNAKGIQPEPKPRLLIPSAELTRGFYLDLIHPKVREEEGDDDMRWGI